MMKRLYILIALMMVVACGIKAQVVNRALQFSETGKVDCGRMPQMADLSSYSFQFWVNPDKWTEGATILSLGDFSIKLGENDAIDFINGDNHLSVSYPELKAGEWNQVTLICENGNANVLINGKEAKKGKLGVIKSTDSSFLLGEGFSGKLDEVRVWNALLNEKMKTFDYFTNNTLNKFCPQWENLVAYYKMDQENCPNLIEYTTLDNPDKGFNNHGIISAGVERVEANNDKMPYLINAAYTESRRALDPEVSQDQYLLSNQLIILGADAYSDGHIEERTPNNHHELRNYYAGRDGVKVYMAVAGTYRVRENLGDWRELLYDPEKRMRFANDLAKLSDGYDGVELDLEWIEKEEEWTLFGLLAEDIKSVLPEDKEFRISLHNYYCKFPKEQQGIVDGFTFQQYGPQPKNFSYEEYLRNVEKFKENFDRNKIMTSYSTTTSRGEKGSPVRMTRHNVLDDYTPNDNDIDSYTNAEDTWKYAGPMQVYKRAKHTRENNLQGIFYWDMMGDVRNEDGTPATFNHAKYCSYGINANNDKKIHDIKVNHYKK